MKVTKKDLPKREVLLTIKLEEKDIEPHIQKAYERIVKRTNIPGFRKGKAPRAILERYLGQDALKEEALESLLPEALRDAINEEELDSVGMPRVDQVDGDPPVVKATVPLQPLVEFNDYLAIRADEDPTEVTDEQVQELIQYLRREQAPWEPAERPVAFGDQVTIDVRGSVDERVILDETGIVYIATEENSSPIPGFVDQLIGMKAGDQKEFRITIPDGYGSDELIGNECVFHVTLHENKEKRLAELDDEFAKGVGDGYDSLASLEDKVRSDLQTEEERVARRRYEERVIPLLVECAKVELSPLLVDHEVTHMLADERESLKRQQVDVEQYLQNVGKSADEHEEELRTTALDRLTRSYVMRKFAELEEINVSPDDLEKEIDTLVESLGDQADSVRRSFDDVERRQSLSDAVLTRRTLERLTEIARG